MPARSWETATLVAGPSRWMGIHWLSTMWAVAGVSPTARPTRTRVSALAVVTFASTVGMPATVPCTPGISTYVGAPAPLTVTVPSGVRAGVWSVVAGRDWSSTQLPASVASMMGAPARAASAVALSWRCAWYHVTRRSV